jgi:hypothetical protein
MVMKNFRGKAYPKCSNKECSTNARKKSAGKDVSETEVEKADSDSE